MTINIVVPISGGKDSQACVKSAVLQYGSDKVIGLFNDTGWEHPLTYEHIDKISNLYGIEIIRTIGSVENEIKKLSRFPNPICRFCTDRLKIKKTKDFLDSLSKKIGSFEVWYGMRADESNDRKKRYKDVFCDEVYAPHDINSSYPKYLEKRGVYFRLPIINWTKEEVFSFLNNEHNPLYNYGFTRVGCFPCLASGKKNHSNAFNFDSFGQTQKQRVIELENIIGKKHVPANTDQMCMFCHI